MNEERMQAIDQQLQQNQAEMNNIQKFLNAKQMELSNLQQFLLQEFQQVQNWNDQKQKLAHLFHNQIKGLLDSFKQFCSFFNHQWKKELFEYIKESMGMVSGLVELQNSKIKEQGKEINALRMELDRERRKLRLSSSTNRLLTPQKNLSSSKFLNKSTFFEYHYEKSKSKDQLSRSPEVEEKSTRKKASLTKQIMREVQKSLRDDHSNQKHFADQKKYVKEKIQRLKTRNSAVCYDAGVHRF